MEPKRTPTEPPPPLSVLPAGGRRSEGGPSSRSSLRWRARRTSHCWMCACVLFVSSSVPVEIFVQTVSLLKANVWIPPAESRMDVYGAPPRNPVARPGRSGTRLNQLFAGYKQSPLRDTRRPLITHKARHPIRQQLLNCGITGTTPLVPVDSVSVVESSGIRH